MGPWCLSQLTLPTSVWPPLPTTLNRSSFATDPTATYPTSAILNGTPPSPLPLVLPGLFVDGTGNRFVGYEPTRGIVPIADANMVAFSAGMTAGNAVVNFTAAGNLPDFNPVVWGLRTSANIGSPTGNNNDATITFGGSNASEGGIIFINGADNTTVTINPNVRFGTAGDKEAVIYFAGGGTNRNAALAGNITANGVTKFGAGILQIVNDQSDNARGVGQGYSNGWVINEGSINALTFGSLGNAAPTNTVVLNGNQASTPTLFLRANPADTTLKYTYTSGRIIAVGQRNGGLGSGCG